MKRIGFHLQKGGVGKTTLSASLAFEISRKHRTILIDSDPQGNASTWLLGDQVEVRHELADVLFGRIKPDQAIVAIRENLALLSTFGLGGELKNYGETQLFREPFAFDDLCQGLERLGYAFAIFDLSPGMSQLERSVLLALSEVVIPMMPDIFSLDGLEIFRDELQRTEKAFRRQIPAGRLVINALNRTIKQHVEIHEVAKKTQYQVYTVGQDSVFRKAQAEHVAPQEMDGQDKMKKGVAAEIRRLAVAVMGV